MSLQQFKNHLYILALFLLAEIVSISCKKSVSDEVDFTGLWKETGKTARATIDLKNDGSIYFFDTRNPLHHWYYAIEEEPGQIVFSDYDNPETKWQNPYYYDDLSKELTIWGLYISIPENPSKTTFKKE